jgi:hypothetical protein
MGAARESSQTAVTTDTASTNRMLSPFNPKYKRFTDTSQRLSRPMANLIGRWIARDLG